MYKMILIDIDGTLIKDDLTIPKENIRAIREASQRGIKIVLSTGRMFLSAKQYTDELGLTDPVISSNGAYVVSNDLKTIYHEKNLKPDDISFVSETLRPYGSSWNFYNHDTMFVEEVREYVLRYEKMAEDLPLSKRITIKYIDENYTVKDLILEHGHEIQKGIVFPKEHEVEEIRNKLKTNKNISVVSSSLSNIEVTHKNADKGQGALSLARQLNIKAEEIMCFGDSGNDLPMFESVGFPIAMDNAIDDLKRVSKYITDTNENSGVAKAIDKFILKKD